VADHERFLAALARYAQAGDGEASLTVADGEGALHIKVAGEPIYSKNGISISEGEGAAINQASIGDDGELVVLRAFLQSWPHDRWWPLDLAIERLDSGTWVARLETAIEDPRARPLRPILGLIPDDQGAPGTKPADEGDAEVEPILVGSYRIELVRQVPVEQWETASRQTSDGIANIYEVFDDAGVDLLIADVTFENGDRDVRLLDAGESDPIFERLAQGLRLGVRSFGDVLCVDLGQTRVTDSHSARPWSQVYIASNDDLDAGFGGSVEAALRSLGAADFGQRKDVIDDTSPRRNYYCVTFPRGAHLVPLAAYVATRVAPLTLQVEADPRAEPEEDLGALDEVDAQLPQEPEMSQLFSGSPLYAWQRTALESWSAAGYRGIVEAVTGAGKTRVAIQAIRDFIDLGGRAMVLVPLTGLQAQWKRQIQRELPHARIGFLGGGRTDRLLDVDVLVATLQTAHRLGIDAVGTNDLLVVDEVHRAGAERFSSALRPSFERRLGLSATYQRMDGAHETVLMPYFEQVVCSYGYPEAITDGVISPFQVAMIGVDFTSGERAVYDDLSEQLRSAKRTLVSRFGVPDAPFEDFINAVFALAKQGTRVESIAANRYLNPFTKRRQLLAASTAKYRALSTLAPAVMASHGAIVFTQTVEAADKAARVLGSRGVSIGVVNGQMGQASRADVLGRFSRGYLKALAAPQVLDEGLDVPEADLGIVLAASKQRRQMVQRMGRVLRRKADGRGALFIVLFVKGTSEDPSTGAHQSFIAELVDNAEACRTFDIADGGGGEVEAFLDRRDVRQAAT
jgi:superfamily II DNA or RNA helicase